MFENICSNVSVLKTVMLLKTIITVIKVAVPIILIITLMLNFVKAITEEEKSEISKSAVSRLVAAILIFVVPTLINVVLSAISLKGQSILCIKEATKERIASLSISTMEKYLSKAEESLSIGDYNRAQGYLNNVEGIGNYDNYVSRLETLKKKIDETKPAKDPTKSEYDNTDYGTHKFVYHSKSGDLPAYAISVPSNAGNAALPMIIWLHGSGERGSSKTAFLNSGLLGVVNKWPDTGLKNIPAIIVAPHITNQNSNWSGESTKINNLILELQKTYKINGNKISLIGHSLGGSGVVYVSSALQDKFSSLVVLSGYASDPDKSKEYFENIPLKGWYDYGSKDAMTKFFTTIGRTNNLYDSNASHAEVPKIVLSEDKNNDKISDIIYWMLSQIKGRKENYIPSSNYSQDSTFAVIKPNMELYKNTETDSLKIYITKGKGYYLANIWVRDPYNQIKKGVIENWGKKREKPSDILNREINSNGLKNKALIGMNGSGFYVRGAWEPNSKSYNEKYNITSEGALVITNSKIVRNWYYDEAQDKNRNDVIYAINKNGNIDFYTDTLKMKENDRKKVFEQIISKGYKNTWAFRPVILENGSVSSKIGTFLNNSAKRTIICQINTNNFVMISTYDDFNKDKIVEILTNQNCQTAINLDGGGSIAMLYKERNKELTIINGNNRDVVDTIYFTEK